MGFTGFYWVLQCSIRLAQRFYQIYLVQTGFPWVLPSFHWVFDVVIRF